MIDDEKMAEWARLSEAATPDRPGEHFEVWHNSDRGGCLREEDGAFFVAARSAVPALLAEVERLRTALEWIDRNGRDPACCAAAQDALARKP